MRKVLYLYGGPFHPSEEAGQVLAEILAADGRFELETTSELNALATLNNKDYAAVVIYTTGFRDDLSPAREQGLLGFIRNGGGFVGIHSANDSFRGNRNYIEMIGGEFQTHPPMHEFKVSIVNHDHYLTTRMPDFTVVDEMYHLSNYDPTQVTLLAQTPWQGTQKPMAFVKSYGKGRVAYLANGHSIQVWRHPEFAKLVLRAIAWSAGADLPDRAIHCGLLGYGPAFNMGKGHGGFINDTPGMKTVAMCDAAPARVEAAKQELPGLEGYYADVDDLLAHPGLDLVVIILPHSLHAPMAVKCLEAGKHVITEKPFCLSVAEANAMIATAEKNHRMLSVFHNRRWDGDFITIQDLIARGLIGDVFHIEAGIGGYSHPGFWWRSDKTVSGGVMFDWGAHIIDWILCLVPSQITQVMGDFQKRVWMAVTNEDQGEAYIRFANGTTADFLVSSIAASLRPKWRITGTKGAIVADWNENLQLVSYASGIRQESAIKVTLPGYGSVQYYRNVADHLLLGEQLIVTPQSARRVIGIFEAAQRSSETGRSLPPFAGCE
ncbi:MAG: ThuA domain-containing protein [Chloroflexi bacterium]|nr:ThuA domain-containing protein [Chloroflexota bacterium]